MWSFFITTIGWFAWLSFLDGVFAATSGPYSIRGSFTKQFGLDVVWWATLFGVLAMLGLFEMILKTLKRALQLAGLWQFPPWKTIGLSDDLTQWDLELWQELEQNPAVREQLKKMAQDEEDDVNEDEIDVEEGKDDGRSHEINGATPPSRFAYLISRCRQMIPFRR